MLLKKKKRPLVDVFEQKEGRECPVCHLWKKEMFMQEDGESCVACKKAKEQFEKDGTIKIFVDKYSIEKRQDRKKIKKRRYNYRGDIHPQNTYDHYRAKQYRQTVMRNDHVIDWEKLKLEMREAALKDIEVRCDEIMQKYANESNNDYNTDDGE